MQAAATLLRPQGPRQELTARARICIAICTLQLCLLAPPPLLLSHHERVRASRPWAHALRARRAQPAIDMHPRVQYLGSPRSPPVPRTPAPAPLSKTAIGGPHRHASARPRAAQADVYAFSLSLDDHQLAS